MGNKGHKYISKQEVTYLDVGKEDPYKQTLIDRYNKLAEEDEDLFDNLKEFVRSDEAIKEFHLKETTLVWPVSEKRLLAPDGYFHSLTFEQAQFLYHRFVEYLPKIQKKENNAS